MICGILIICILGIINIIQLVCYNGLISDYNELFDKKNSLESSVLSQESEINELKNENDLTNYQIERLTDKKEELEDKLFFWDSHACIVYSFDENTYHKFGSTHDMSIRSSRDDYTFWIYNTEAAESIGIHRCHECYQ